MTAPHSVYVSITGLVLHSPLQWPRFALHASASMVQARRAAGNRLAQARMIDGIHHTLSVWDSREAMKAYLKSGAHLQAMRAFSGIGLGKTYGFETDKPPDWSDIPAIYAAHARDV